MRSEINRRSFSAKSGVKVQHKRVGVSAEFGDDERNALDHQSGNEGDITREAIELGHDHRAFCLAGKGEGGIQLRPSIKSIRALSGFDLGELLEDDRWCCSCTMRARPAT